MPFADANGVKIYYEVLGQGDPLVLIQGYGHHLLHWAALPDQFTGLNYKVILIDNRGVGRSDKPDAPVAIPQMADDVCVILDALSIKRASVFGVSMGGMIAQEFALNHPDRLINLILGCTWPGGPNSVKPSPVDAARLFDLNSMNALTPEERSKTIFSYFCSEDFIQENPDALKRYHEVTLQYPTPLHTLRNQLDAITKFDTWDRLSNIKAPTMIIAGTSDHIIPFKNSELLEGLIPGAELTLLQDKRHGFYIEGMDSTRIFVNGFMKRRSKR